MMMDFSIHHCPQCGGSGKNCDASLDIGPGKKSSFTPATDCQLCGGLGLVRITPLSASEVAAYRTHEGAA